MENRNITNGDIHLFFGKRKGLLLNYLVYKSHTTTKIKIL